MCGIAGIFDLHGQREISADLLKRMSDSIRHRGPDGEGFFHDGGIGLAHRRLAIIDIGGGDQPLYNEDGSIAVVFNGEIYNFQELAEELTRAGHRFKTHCDTEVIVHGWEEWGPDCLQRFRGMFALALWDSRDETLFLARDRFGKKPLHYATLDDGQLIFASEIKALTCHPALNRAIDIRAIEDYFAYGYIPDPRSIFTAVHKLPGGHYLQIRRGRKLPEPVCYWDLRFQNDTLHDEAAAIGALTDRLKTATDLRMIADVPLGAFLSGGVDSSGVVAMMAGLSEQPVKTFSIAFDDPEYDESAYARMIATRYGTDHFSRMVDPQDIGLVDRLSDIYDEPFGDDSAMPTLRVCETARERVTVALSGDGGDEIFAGYRRYPWHVHEERLRALLPASVRRALFGTLGRLYPKLDWAPRIFRAKNTFQELALNGAEGYFMSVSVLNDALRDRLYSARMKRELDGYHAIEVLRRHMEAADTDDALAQAQYADIKTYLPGDILTKVDRASMAVSLEVRAPLLDHRIGEWAAALAPELRLNGNTGKYILKKTFEPLVPGDILYRPKKGFAVPVGGWFRGPLRQRIRDAVASPLMGDTGLFDMNFLRQLADEHQSGRRDHAAVLWALLMFESFLRKEAGENATALVA